MALEIVMLGQSAAESREALEERPGADQRFFFLGITPGVTPDVALIKDISRRKALSVTFQKKTDGSN